MKGSRARSALRAAGPPDQELLAAIAAGDLGALGQLYDRYSRDVWRATHRILAGSADVEDVVHMVFIKLPEIAKSYDGRSTARAWLIGIAAHIAWRQRRGAGRFFRMLDAFASTTHSTQELDPEREASAREEVRDFERSVAALTPSKRIVFTLIELEGLTSDEVATALSLPAATVRTRLHHARRELQGAFAAKKSGERQ